MDFALDYTDTEGTTVFSRDTKGGTVFIRDTKVLKHAPRRDNTQMQAKETSSSSEIKNAGSSPTAVIAREQEGKDIRLSAQVPDRVYYTTQRGKPFTFYTISELVQLTADVVKITDYLKTVGLCVSESFQEWYLKELESDNPLEQSSRIQLAFDCIDTAPAVGTKVEVFGCLRFETKNGKQVPRFLVWFFRERHGGLASYIKKLLEVRQILAGECNYT